MNKMFKVFMLIVCICSSNVWSQNGFFSNFNPPNLPGERRIAIDVDLRGLDINRYTVTCIYSDDSMVVVNALNPTRRTGTEPRAEAAREAIRNDNSKMRCSIILPHNIHPTPNKNDRNPKQIGAPNRVYCAWIRENRIDGVREPLSIPSQVSGFKVPRLLIISYSGDSYASGEGAPNAVSTRLQDRWDMEDGVGGDCHRSERSGGVKAIQKFRKEHPELAVKYVNVTCSGALLQDIYDFRSRGASNGVLPPQLDQIKAKIGNRNVVDIFLSDGGGNDVILVDIGTNALTDIFGNICDDKVQQKTLNDAIASVADRYETIDAVLTSGKMISGKDLGFKVGKVIWFNYPSPLQDKDGNLCTPRTGGLCWGPLERGISDCDWRWIRDNIFPKINGAISKAANDNKWDLVDISSGGNKHGMCNCDEPYFNTLGQSLFTQVDHRGTMHPNDEGFTRIYRDKIFEQLEKTVTEYHNELKPALSATSLKSINKNVSKITSASVKLSAQTATQVKITPKKNATIEALKMAVKPTRPVNITIDTQPIKKVVEPVDNSD